LTAGFILQPLGWGIAGPGLIPSAAESRAPSKPDFLAAGKISAVLVKPSYRWDSTSLRPSEWQIRICPAVRV